MQKQDFVVHTAMKQWYSNLLFRTVCTRTKISTPVMRLRIFFGARQDAEDMEEAISNFLDHDGLEENEFRDFDQV
jgi:hypothetical protein